MATVTDVAMANDLFDPFLCVLGPSAASGTLISLRIIVGANKCFCDNSSTSSNKAMFSWKDFTASATTKSVQCEKVNVNKCVHLRLAFILFQVLPLVAASTLAAFKRSLYISLNSGTLPMASK